MTTIFLVEPLDGNSRVTLSTRSPVRPGPLGAVERWITMQFTRRIYRQELRCLDAFMRGALADPIGDTGV